MKTNRRKFLGMLGLGALTPLVSKVKSDTVKTGGVFAVDPLQQYPRDRVYYSAVATALVMKPFNKGHLHVYYTPEDFTSEEVRRDNPLAIAVIRDGYRICKFCGKQEN